MHARRSAGVWVCGRVGVWACVCVWVYALVRVKVHQSLGARRFFRYSCSAARSLPRQPVAQGGRSTSHRHAASAYAGTPATTNAVTAAFETHRTDSGTPVPGSATLWRFLRMSSRHESQR